MEEGEGKTERERERERLGNLTTLRDYCYCSKLPVELSCFTWSPTNSNQGNHCSNFCIDLCSRKFCLCVHHSSLFLFALSLLFSSSSFNFHQRFRVIGLYSTTLINGEKEKKRIYKTLSSQLTPAWSLEIYIFTLTYLERHFRTGKRRVEGGPFTCKSVRRSSQAEISFTCLT